MVINEFNGGSSRCLVFGNILIKLYNVPKNKNYFTDLSNYKSSLISFPISYIYSGEYVIGEIMPYYDKKGIVYGLDEHIEIKKFIKDYFVLCNEMENYPEICMRDLCSPNVLYDSNGFRLIDTSDWQICEKYNNYDLNKLSFDYVIYSTLYDLIELYDKCFDEKSAFHYNLIQRGNEGKDLFELLKLSENHEYHIIEILELYEYLHRNDYDKSLQTFAGIKKYTKKLKKD